MPHKVGQYGGYLDPELVLLASFENAWAKVELAEGDDGRWRLGLNVKDLCGGFSVAPTVRTVKTYASRQLALDAAIESARRHFKKRAVGDHVWRRSHVHAQARALLAQLDELAQPAGEQLSLF